MRTRGWLGWVAGMALLATGCDVEDRYDTYDPPEGRGMAVVDNGTGSSFRVYFNGHRQDRDARRGRTTGYDLDPGGYRLVLEEINGYRNVRMDLDILEDRNTVILVDPGACCDDLAVSVFFTW